MNSIKGRRGFTVIELIVGFVILVVVFSLAISGYERYQDRTMMLVDDTNQKVLQASIKLYAYDTNALPGNLSELDSGTLRRAYALMTHGKQPYTLWAYLKQELGLLDIAEAIPLPEKYYNGDASILTCPSDPTPPAEGGVSYVLAPGWENRPLSALLDARNADEPLIIEADETVNRQVVFRHGHGTLSVQMTVKGEHQRKTGRAVRETEWKKKPVRKAAPVLRRSSTARSDLPEAPG